MLAERVAADLQRDSVSTLEIISAFLRAVEDALVAGDRCEFRDFGNFDLHERKARKARDPRTMTIVDVPPRRVVRYKPGKRLYERVEEAGNTPEGDADVDAP